MICEKDGEEISWYHEHHLWPKFMDNPHGKAYLGYVSRVVLCKEHHLELHSLITKKKEWKKTPNEKKQQKIKETVEKSWGWLNE